MNKDEILKRAQEEGKGKDLVDFSIQQRSAYLAYFIGIVLIMVVDVIEAIVFRKINYGSNMVLFSMCFIAFLYKFIKLKKKHELLVSLIYGCISLMFLVLWVLKLVGVI